VTGHGLPIPYVGDCGCRAFTALRSMICGILQSDLRLKYPTAVYTPPLPVAELIPESSSLDFLVPCSFITSPNLCPPLPRLCPQFLEPYVGLMTGFSSLSSWPRVFYVDSCVYYPPPSIFLSLRALSSPSQSLRALSSPSQSFPKLLAAHHTCSDESRSIPTTNV
jgi:hypothetical protein